MLNVKKLQAIRDKILGVTVNPGGYGDLDSVVYLEQILDALLGTNALRVRGNLNEKIYLQKIRNAIRGQADGQFGSLSNSIYLQQILNAFNNASDGAYGSLGANSYLDKIVDAARPLVTVSFLLRDDFNDTLSAGSVNGTLATPTGGTRTVADTNSKLSVSAGAARVATGGSGDNNPRLYYAGLSSGRVAGRTFIGELTSTSNRGNIGWTNRIVDGEPAYGHIFRLFTNEVRIYNDVGTAIVVADKTGGVSYLYATVLRVTGAIFFIKGGTEFPVWTLLYCAKGDNPNPVYPLLSGVSTTGVFSVSTMRVPTDLIVITPIASDAFTRGNGALGNTGGGGSAEAGGTGKAWTSQLGTWGVATNKAACSAVDGPTSIGVATVDAGTPNVMVEVVATRAAGTSGLCLRYTDANNYIKAIHNGTNIQVIEVVGGVPNTLINTAAAYGAAFRMVISLKGTKVRMYYNNNFIGAEAATVVGTGNNMGLFTDDTGATFDNFVVWAKGNGGEYAVLDTYANP